MLSKTLFVIAARDPDEKEKWIEALENTILRHSQPALVRVHVFLTTGLEKATSMGC